MRNDLKCPKKIKDIIDELLGDQSLNLIKEGATFKGVFKDIRELIQLKLTEYLGTLSNRQEVYNEFSYLVQAFPNTSGKFGELLSKELGLGKEGLDKVTKSDYQFSINIKETELPFSNKERFNPDEIHYFTEDQLQKSVIVDTKIGDGNFDPKQLQNYLLLRNNHEEFLKNPPILEEPQIQLLFLPNGTKDCKLAAEEALDKIEGLIGQGIIDKKTLEDKHLVIKYLDSDGNIQDLN